MCIGTPQQQGGSGVSGQAVLYQSLFGRLPDGMDASGSPIKPGMPTAAAVNAAGSLQAPSAKAGSAVTAKTGSSSAGGGGMPAQAGAGLLTPAFATGTAGFKQLTGM